MNHPITLSSPPVGIPQTQECGRLKRSAEQTEHEGGEERFLHTPGAGGLELAVAQAVHGVERHFGMNEGPKPEKCRCRQWRALRSWIGCSGAAHRG